MLFELARESFWSSLSWVTKLGVASHSPDYGHRVNDRRVHFLEHARLVSVMNQSAHRCQIQNFLAGALSNCDSADSTVFLDAQFEEPCTSSWPRLSGIAGNRRRDLKLFQHIGGNCLRFSVGPNNPNS